MAMFVHLAPESLIGLIRRNAIRRMRRPVKRRAEEGRGTQWDALAWARDHLRDHDCVSTLSM